MTERPSNDTENCKRPLILFVMPAQVTVSTQVCLPRKHLTIFLFALHCRLLANRFWVQFPAGADPFCVSLHVLPVSAWVPSGCSAFLPQSKDMQINGWSKLPVGVNVSVNGCLSLRQVFDDPGWPRCHPVSVGIGSNSAKNKQLWIKNKWMNIWSAFRIWCTKFKYQS